MAKFTVLSPVNHDGKDYAIGATIDLTAESAEPLLKGGAVETAAATKAKEKAGEGAADGAGEA